MAESSAEVQELKAKLAEVACCITVYINALYTCMLASLRRAIAHALSCCVLLHLFISGSHDFSSCVCWCAVLCLGGTR